MIPLLPARKPAAGGPCECVHHLETGPIAMATCVRCFGTGQTDPQRDKTMKKNRQRRLPSKEDIQAFTGAHCNRLYASIGADWRCPGCHRTKYELLRWTMLYPNSPRRHMGWAGGLHKHHDHGLRPRFEETLMCEQCNNADTAAKRELRLPNDFSFSPREINCFICATPHGWHLINYTAAANLYAVVQRPVPLVPSIFWPPGTPS